MHIYIRVFGFFFLFENMCFMYHLEIKIQILTGSNKKKKSTGTQKWTLHTHGQPLKNSDLIASCSESYVTRTSRRSLIDEQRAVPQACKQEVRSMFETQDRRTHSIPEVQKTLSWCIHAPVDQNTAENQTYRRITNLLISLLSDQYYEWNLIFFLVKQIYLFVYLTLLLIYYSYFDLQLSFYVKSFNFLCFKYFVNINYNYIHFITFFI